MRNDSHITIKQLAEYIGISTRAVEKQIAILNKNKLIKRIGSDKSGHWEILNKNH